MGSANLWKARQELGRKTVLLCRTESGAGIEGHESRDFKDADLKKWKERKDGDEFWCKGFGREGVGAATGPAQELHGVILEHEIDTGAGMWADQRSIKSSEAMW